MSLTLRDVEVDGRTGVDVRVEAGRIAEIGVRLGPSEDEIDGRSGALIPGLADHHIHLFALAAQADSEALGDVAGPAELRRRLVAAAGRRAVGAWVRATGYHERIAGDLTRDDLDALAPAHPLRLQHQTGALWVLNSQALALVGADEGPACVERDAAGRPTGRIWRGDDWLLRRLPRAPPPLAPIGRQLAAYGVTSVTDASVTTDDAAAARLAAAGRAGELPQRLTLMSGGPLKAPADGAFVVGPVKVLLDEHALIDLGDFIARIGEARDWGRTVAVHCVTAAELALTLAALEAAGGQLGDRIEHGGVIPAEAIARLKALGLTVVTQPAFVRERGDRYLAEVEARDQPDLYRCASLRAGGVPVAFSSDAPYAMPDPWAGIAAAVERTTRQGQSLGLAERVDAGAGLAMYLGAAGAPGGDARRIGVGSDADLCLLDVPLADVLSTPRAEHVRATLVAGRVVYDAEAN